MTVTADTDRPTFTRAFACIALGLVGETTDLPWNEPLRAHANYRAAVASLQEANDVL